MCHDGDIADVACANDTRAMTSYARVMHTTEEKEQVMKRIAVIVAIVLGVAATPTVVTASTSAPAKSDIYAHAKNWNSRVGPLYGPVQTESSYGFISK